MIASVDVKNSIGLLRLQLAIIHISMSAASFIRPHMIEIFPAYAKFGEIGGTLSWAWVMMAIGLGLLLLPRGTILLILWQAASAIMFCLFAILLTDGSGLTWGTMVYASLALTSVIVAYITADTLFGRNQLPQKVRALIEGESRGPSS